MEVEVVTPPQKVIYKFRGAAPSRHRIKSAVDMVDAELANEQALLDELPIEADTRPGPDREAVKCAVLLHRRVIVHLTGKRKRLVEAEFGLAN